MNICVKLPIRAVSVSNIREHWSVRAKRTKAHRHTATTMLMMVANGLALAGPVVVTLNRSSPRKLDDDNLRGALKAVRDGVADWLGVVDNDPRVTWEYKQQTGKPKEHAVFVTVNDVIR